MFFNNNKCCCEQNNWQQNGFEGQLGCGPVIEPTIERCVERNICHKVEHPCTNMSYKYKVHKQMPNICIRRRKKYINKRLKLLQLVK